MVDDFTSVSFLFFPVFKWSIQELKKTHLIFKSLLIALDKLQTLLGSEACHLASKWQASDGELIELDNTSVHISNFKSLETQ